MNAKITQGKVSIGLYGQVLKENGERLIISGVALTTGNHPDQKEAEANASLLAESITVTNECGLTPRQLLDKNIELKKQLEMEKKSATALSERVSMREKEIDVLDNQRNELLEALNDILWNTPEGAEKTNSMVQEGRKSNQTGGGVMNRYCCQCRCKLDNTSRDYLLLTQQEKENATYGICNACAIRLNLDAIEDLRLEYEAKEIMYKDYIDARDSRKEQVKLLIDGIN